MAILLLALALARLAVQRRPCRGSKKTRRTTRVANMCFQKNKMMVATRPRGLVLWARRMAWSAAAAAAAAAPAPRAFAALMAEGEGEGTSEALRRVLVGGDVATRDEMRTWMGSLRGPDAKAQVVRRLVERIAVADVDADDEGDEEDAQRIRRRLYEGLVTMIPVTQEFEHANWLLFTLGQGK